MTFSSEVVQTLFHQLPTERQVEYVRLEDSLADAGKLLAIEAVSTDGTHLDVIIRISEKLNAGA